MGRRIFTLCLILALFFSLSASSSYSSASVASSARLRIVESKDALLAVKEAPPELGAKSDNGHLLTGQSRYFAVKIYTIKNNSSNTMDVKLKCTKSFDDARVYIYTGKDKPVKWQKWKTLKPGKSIKAIVLVQGSRQLPGKVPLELKGKWKWGSAKVWWSFDATENQQVIEEVGPKVDEQPTDEQPTSGQLKENIETKVETSQDETKDTEQENIEKRDKDTKDEGQQQDVGEQQKESKEQQQDTGDDPQDIVQNSDLMEETKENGDH